MATMPDRLPPSPLGARVALVIARVVAGLTGLMIAGAFFKFLFYSFDGWDAVFLAVLGLAFWISSRVSRAAVAYLSG